MEPSTHPLCGLWRISLYCLGGCYPDTEPERQAHMRITTTAVELGACTEEPACTWRYRTPIALGDDCLEHVRFADVPDDGVQLLNVCPHNPPWASATMLWQINGREVVAEVLGQQLDDCQ